MECHCRPAAELPHVTRLYSSFLNDFSSVSQFYFHPPSWDGIAQAVKDLRMEHSQRRAVADVLHDQNRLFGSDDRTLRNLDRLRSGAVAVVTGQQVGLFGGPAYSVYKALTAIRVAKELTTRGTDAVPVFWLATEDHDLAEIDHCFFGTRGAVERFDLATPGGQGKRAGEITLGNGVGEISTRAVGMFEGIGAEEVSRWIRESYGPAETYGTAFGKLMARVFAGRGLILLDPISPELHRLSSSTMVRAIEEHQILAQELVARSAALESSGFHAQVKVTGSSTLVFRIVDGQRVPLRPVKDGFVAGAQESSLAKTLQAAMLFPEQFSANALLRPVIQDTLLPTVAYIAGAAEAAYYAQGSVVYKRLLGRAPTILPRAGFTLVTAHVANLLKKYKLSVDDIFAGRQRFRARLESEALPQGLTAGFAEGESKIKEALERLRQPLTRLDQTLVGSLDTAIEKMLYQFNSLRAKAGRAEGFRTGVLDAHEREIVNLLLPNNELQERSLSLLPFLASAGPALLDALDQHINTGTGEPAAEGSGTGEPVSRPVSGEHCFLYL